MEKLTDSNFLTPPFPHCKPCLLYADDTLILLKPTRSQALKVKLILDTFGLITGLKINLLKSELAINSPQSAQAHSLAQVIQCRHGKFPITYLGLPLSDKKLNRADYMPIIEKIQRMLGGWKASLLSIGGRMLLTNVVLAAIPHYFMSVFLLPTWVVQKIDQIRKRFLWHGHKDPQKQLNNLYMVNWSLALKPRDQGGLGIRDIRVANQALLMKWLWYWNDHTQLWWKQPSQMPNANDRPWNDPHSSLFWKSLKSIAPGFNCSVRYSIGDGKGTSFWHDNWNDSPLKFLYPNLYAEVQDQNASVYQCLSTGGLVLQSQLLSPLAQYEENRMAHDLQCPILTQAHDSVSWIRNPTGFTVRSAYHFLTHAPSPTSNRHNIWTIKAPPRVSVFIWLMLSNRLATTDNLIKRGWSLPNMCVLCRKDEEMIKHIFQQCTLSKEIRNYLFSAIPVQQAFSPKFTTECSFDVLTDPSENQHVRQREVVTCFVIWRERCRRLFSDRTATQMVLLREITAELKAWFC